MRIVSIAILLLGISSCGKAPAQESAALSSAMLCKDVLACVQWCQNPMNFTPATLCKSTFLSGSGTTYETCPSAGGTCTTVADLASCQAPQEADRSARCLDLPKDQVIP